MLPNKTKTTTYQCLVLIAFVVFCSLGLLTACSSHLRGTSCWPGWGRNIAWVVGGESSRLRMQSTSFLCPGTNQRPRLGLQCVEIVGEGMGQEHC